MTEMLIAAVVALYLIVGVIMVVIAIWINMVDSHEEYWMTGLTVLGWPLIGLVCAIYGILAFLGILAQTIAGVKE